MNKNNKSNINQEEEDNVQFIYIEQQTENISLFTSLSLIALVFFGLYAFVPDVKELVNPLFKFVDNPFKSLNSKLSNIKTNETIIKQEEQTKEEQIKEDKKNTKGKSISTSLLFTSNVSIGSRFIGMAEGNYILTKSGTYSNTSNYSGHIEPSGAVPKGTVNQGFCSTPITSSNTTKEQKVNIANNKCLKRLRSLTIEVNKGLNWNNTKLSEPQLSLFLNTIDLGNQARGEVKRNMYTYQIPKALKQGRTLTLADITKMRRDSFYSKEKGRLKSALGTIPALRRKAKQHCGNDLEPNIISADQSRRVIAANKSLNNIGMGLPPMTTKQIMEQICVKPN